MIDHEFSLADRESLGTTLNDLIIQGQEGDVDAFEPVVHRFQDMAVGYSYAMLQDWQMGKMQRKKLLSMLISTSST